MVSISHFPRRSHEEKVEFVQRKGGCCDKETDSYFIWDIPGLITINMEEKLREIVIQMFIHPLDAK